jgi:hypothetical protein
MGIQDKIARSQISARHKLRDYNLSQSGIETQVVRLKTEENMYGDETVEIVDNDIITLALDLPDEVPQTRLRTDVTQQIAETQSYFFFDILPIEGYSQLEDNVEKGDIIVYTIHDAKDKPSLHLVLRVSELIGTISNRYLTSRKFQCAPYNMALPQQVQDIIENYKEA